jgi:hypothetical protein
VHRERGLALTSRDYDFLLYRRSYETVGLLTTRSVRNYSLICARMDLDINFIFYCNSVVPILRDRNIFMQSAQFLEIYHDSMSSAVALTVIQALVLMADSEDFATYKNEYVREEADALLLNRLNDSCLKQFQKDFTNKRMMRPLTDCISQFRRKYK